MSFNEKFLEFFEEKRLTHGQIAQKLGVSRPTINRILNEEHPPSFKVLQNFAIAYPTIDLNYFIRDDFKEYVSENRILKVAEDRLTADLLSEIRLLEQIVLQMKNRLSQY